MGTKIEFERLSNLPEVMQLINSKAGMQIHGRPWPQNLARVRAASPHAAVILSEPGILFLRDAGVVQQPPGPGAGTQGVKWLGRAAKP